MKCLNLENIPVYKNIKHFWSNVILNFFEMKPLKREKKSKKSEGHKKETAGGKSG